MNEDVEDSGAGCNERCPSCVEGSHQRCRSEACKCQFKNVQSAPVVAAKKKVSGRRAYFPTREQRHNWR